MTSPSIDPRHREFFLPTRIVWQSVGDAAPVRPEVLLHNNTGQARLDSDNICRMRQGSGLLLDFGRELHGGIQLVTGQMPDQHPFKVRIRFGESVTEAMREPNNDHAMHDFVCDLPFCGTFEVGNTGFRFVRIDVLDDRALQFVACRAVSLMRDLPYRGRFLCDDARLNQIWQTGARTVHLCMQEYVWDGIKRDRLVWIGDMHPITSVISAVFGEQAIVRESLDFVRDLTTLPDWMNGISSYSIWWILIHHHWYRHHGNLAYLQEQREYLVRLLEHLLVFIDADGSERLDGMRFLDWPSFGDEPTVHAGLQALLTMGMTAGAELCQALGETTCRQRCLEAVERLRSHGQTLSTSAKQANALLALSGIANATETNARVLAVDPLHGISAFYGYYVLQARALAGDYAGALDVIRRYWGGMLDKGATSFWENFDLAWAENSGRIDEPTPEGMPDIHADFGAFCYQGLRHSLCHGWSAGPTAWLSEHVLGVTPVAPGCKIIQVAPHLDGLTFVEGAFPTPHGDLILRHTKTRDGRIESVVQVPDGVQVVRPRELFLQ